MTSNERIIVVIESLKSNNYLIERMSNDLGDQSEALIVGFLFKAAIITSTQGPWCMLTPALYTQCPNLFTKNVKSPVIFFTALNIHSFILTSIQKWAH